MIEIEGGKAKPVLTNYASCQSPLRGKEGRENKEGFLRLSHRDLKDLLNRLLAEVEVKADKAAISIPIYSTFTTLIDLPFDLADKNTEEAIQFKAKKHVPVDLSQVVLEWHFIDGVGKEGEARKVFVVAIPKETVEKYRKVSGLIPGLNIELLEIEIFSLARMIKDGGKSEVIMIDIGGKNTNATLVRDGTIEDTLNVNVSGEDLTRTLMSDKKISFDQASELKKEKGLTSASTRKSLEPLLEDVLKRIKRRLFSKSEDPQRVVLSGGSVKLPGFDSYVKKFLDTEVEVINPWTEIDHPKELKNRLQDIAPSYAVACGLALREFQ